MDVLTVWKGKEVFEELAEIYGQLYLEPGEAVAIDAGCLVGTVLDIVENGTQQTKAAMIITDDAKEITDRIYRQLGRTVTIMEGEGLVSGKKAILYCVLTRLEVRELRDIINTVDSSAFIAISDVSEIIGSHIKKTDLLRETVRGDKKDKTETKTEKGDTADEKTENE